MNTAKPDGDQPTTNEVSLRVPAEVRASAPLSQEVREAIASQIKPYEGLLVSPAGDYAHALWDDLCAALAPFFQKTAEENRELRAICAVASAGTQLYHDDGELQDNTARPFIDWKRDSISEIQSKLLERALTDADVKAFLSARTAQRKAST